MVQVPSDSAGEQGKAWPGSSEDADVLAGQATVIVSLGWWTSLPPWTKAPSLSAPSPASSPHWRIEGNPTRPPGEMLGTPGKLGNFHEYHESAHPGARPNATRFYTKTGTGADKASLSSHVLLQAVARREGCAHAQPQGELTTPPPWAGSEPSRRASAWTHPHLIFSGHVPGSICHSGLGSMSPPPEAFPDPQSKATLTTSTALSPSTPLQELELSGSLHFPCVCLPPPSREPEE